MGPARFHTSAERNDIRAHTGAEVAVLDLGRRLTPPAWLPHQHLAEPRVYLCSANRGKDIRISASLLRDIRCGRQARKRVLRPSMTCSNMHLA
jgi:hypothetical protein